MATKKTVIYIEGFGTDDNQFKVYSDLSKTEIGLINGVFAVSDTLYKHEGFLIITIDKRFDYKEILSEIRELALQREQKTNE